MAEGTSLLRMHTAYTRIVGSNPTVSAKVSKKRATARWLFSFLRWCRRVGACAPTGVAKAVDSKLRAYLREGGLQHVGESHRLHQSFKEKSHRKVAFFFSASAAPFGEASLETWFKKAAGWAAIAALVHCAAWAGYVHHLQRASYDALEQRRGVIDKILFAQVSMDGYLFRNRVLELVVRPLDDPQASPQQFFAGGSLEMRGAYFRRHRPADVVPIWVSRRSGRIDDVLPPSPPDLARLFLVLSPTLGLVTFVITAAAVGQVLQGRVHRKAAPRPS